jgi:hypothetical protein
LIDSKTPIKKGEFPLLNYSCLIPSAAAVAAAVTAAAVAAAVTLLLSRFPACRASLRFVLESFFFVKSLFAFIENKFRVAIPANQVLVCHFELPPYLILDITDSLTHISKTIEAYEKKIIITNPALSSYARVTQSTRKHKLYFWGIP